MNNDIRKSFPILEETVNGHPLIYMDNAATTQKPQRVIEAISNYYLHQNANVHRGVHTLSRKATDLFEASREEVRSFLNATSSEEIVFVRGVTEGINLIAASFGRSQLNTGDEIILSGMEHHANIVPWQMLARELKFSIRVIPFSRRGELDLEAYKEAFSPRTRLVGVVHVSNVLGTVNPVKEITAIAHEHGVPVLVDGAQAIAHEKVDVQDLDCDMYALSGHKAYAPTGIGAIYVKKKHLETWPPYHGGGEMIEEVAFGKYPTFAALPYRFEAGTPHMSGVVGLAEALRFIRDTGYDVIQEHEQTLLEHGRKQLSAIPGLTFYGDADRKTAIFSFLIKEIHPLDVGSFLDARGIAVRTGHHCAQPVMQRYGIPGTARASLTIYNTTDEIDYLAECLRDLVKLFV
ncbi:MAG: cysteine desulfurase CsdA [Candidatus Neomarinimicrobiota bacterium]|nr:MAG: cysteine desulfurase CsdA [Candidatus Neomarinimicrobiota bacterium]